GRRNCECIVTPPALRAAMPVGATTAKGLCVRSARLRRNVVLPVPAFPVRKIWAHVLLINRTATSGMLSWSTSEVTGSLFLLVFLVLALPGWFSWQRYKFVKCRVQIKRRRISIAYNMTPTRGSRGPRVLRGSWGQGTMAIRKRQ